MNTAELVAIERRGRGEGSLVAPLLGVRLEPGAALGELSADLIAVAVRDEKRG